MFTRCHKHSVGWGPKPPVACKHIPNKDTCSVANKQNGKDVGHRCSRKNRIRTHKRERQVPIEEKKTKKVLYKALPGVSVGGIMEKIFTLTHSLTHSLSLSLFSARPQGGFRLLDLQDTLCELRSMVFDRHPTNAIRVQLGSAPSHEWSTVRPT